MAQTERSFNYRRLTHPLLFKTSVFVLPACHSRSTTFVGVSDRGILPVPVVVFSFGMWRAKWTLFHGKMSLLRREADLDRPAVGRANLRTGSPKMPKPPRLALNIRAA